MFVFVRETGAEVAAYLQEGRVQNKVHPRAPKENECAVRRDDTGVVFL